MKENLKGLGLSEKQMAELERILGGFVPKEEAENLKSENSALKKKAEELKEKNKALISQHDKEIADIKLENAIDNAISAAGAKNKKAVKAMLELEDAVLCEDGNVKGLAEKLKALKESDGYMFETAAKITGFAPAQGKDGLPGEKNVEDMTYSELAAYMENNPNVRL